MDNEGSKSSKGWDEWMTCPKWIELARTCMGSIDLDTASNPVAQEYVKAERYCVHPDTIKNYEYAPPDNMLFDGLSLEWNGNVWCNPPYSRGNIDAFADKAVAEWKRSIDLVKAHGTHNNYPRMQSMLLLVNSATDARWYHKLLGSSNAVLFVEGRIKFWKIIDGIAYEKWEGEKSKEKGLGKIGNSPRYLNTLFYFGNNVDRFTEVFINKGTIL